MKIVIDMNLSPDWVPILKTAGHTAVHWSSIGVPSASDKQIMAWARENDFTVFTHDLDFGAILAASDAHSPSVVQVRTPDPTPGHCASVIIEVLANHAVALEAGALISVDENRARIRILPLDIPNP